MPEIPSLCIEMERVTNGRAMEPRTPRGTDDHGALGDCWKRYRRWVAAILLAHMPRGADLEDLLQEVAVAFVEGVGSLRDPSKVQPWLRTVALNVARGAGRREQRRRRHQRPLEDAAAQLVDPRPEADRQREERRAAVDRVLELAQQLPAEYREPLLLRCVRGLSQRQIAAVLGVSETAVESRLVRARRRLREAMSRGTR